MKYPWVICVSDGYTIRTIHPAAFHSDDRDIIEPIIERTLIPSVRPIDRAMLMESKPKYPSTPEKSKREIAREHGYTGDPCGNCGEFRLKNSGHCQVCENCGTTTGCS